MDQHFLDWLSHSDYLQRISKKHGDQLAVLRASYTDSLDILNALILEVQNKAEDFQNLRRLKSCFAYFWSVARLYEQRDAGELSRFQTRFADASIDQALRLVCVETPFASMLKTRVRGEANLDGNWPGLFILGLGKLGACDLNFSSDVDLIAFHDPDLFDVIGGHGKADICHRILKRLTEQLSKEVEGEFIWRVDWRLRPNAGTPQLTQNTEAAESFYFFHSQPWHRLAMVKARVVAGDEEAGNSFLKILKPYIWRRNLDFEMIDEIHRLKLKINREHPSLNRVRKIGELDNLSQVRGFNLKLGRGGIREIEFIANALQLLWGGKKSSLRTPSTVDSLVEIGDLELLDAETTTGLVRSYRYFRWLEDAVQIRDNQQEHIVPYEEQSFLSLCSLLGVEKDNLQQNVGQYRVLVASCFEKILEAKDNGSQEAQDEVQFDWPGELTEEASKIWNDWNSGFSSYGINAQAAIRLVPLRDNLTTTLSDCSGDRSTAVMHLDRFLQSMPKIGQYLRLLAEIPRLAEDVLQPVVAVPFLRNLLEQSPYIIDYLLEPNLRDNEPSRSDGFDAVGDDAAFVLQNSDYEIRLERLRRFVNEQLYGFCLATLRGERSSSELSESLNYLAEYTLHLAIRITNEFFRVDKPPLAVLAMGKLGMQAMAPMSDLDLIFIADPEADYEFSVEYSRRLQHLMSLRTREGVAFEMDMRLRPSGSSGPPTVTLASFENYQNSHAKNWEHIALVASRPVAGAPEICDAIQKIIADVLSRPRDSQQLQV